MFCKWMPFKNRVQHKAFGMLLLLNASVTRRVSTAVSRAYVRDRALPASTWSGPASEVFLFLYNLVSSTQITIHCCCARFCCSSSFSLPSYKAAISKSSSDLRNQITLPGGEGKERLPEESMWLYEVHFPITIWFHGGLFGWCFPALYQRITNLMTWKTEMYFLTVLEARSPKSSCRLGCLPLGSRGESVPSLSPSY